MAMFGTGQDPEGEDPIAGMPVGFGAVRLSGFRPEPPAPVFVPDLEYEGQDGIREALSAVRSRAPVVFISGRAGTGKSRLIDYMRKMPGGERQIVVAPTGVAALNLRAQTIHGLFRLPVGVVDAESLPEEERPGRVLRNLTRLVIDEISMVRADILDGIDARLRQIRGNSLPFGGVQTIVVGDFLQLPPVVSTGTADLLGKLGYETPFAFSAKCLQRVPVRVATLRKVWRQSDPDFISVLADIREGRNSTEAVRWLNGRCNHPHREGREPLLLTSTRVAADHYNEKGLSRVGKEREAYRFTAETGGSFGDKGAALPVPAQMELRPGVRVMAVKNDPAGRYVNGSLGVVETMGPETDNDDVPVITVRFDWSGEAVKVDRATWTRTRQTWNEVSSVIEEDITGTYRQVPLVYGWAITIHKSQGLSLDDVRIDLGRGAFAPGQVYVALSRARTLEGLSLAAPMEERDIQVDEMLVRFLQWAREGNQMEFEVPA